MPKDVKVKVMACGKLQWESGLFLVARTVVGCCGALAQGHQIQLQGVEHVENCPLFADVLTSTTLTFIYGRRGRLMEAYGHEIGTYLEKHISTTFSNGRNSVLPVSPTLALHVPDQNG